MGLTPSLPGLSVLASGERLSSERVELVAEAILSSHTLAAVCQNEAHVGAQEKRSSLAVYVPKQTWRNKLFVVMTE